MRSKDVSSNGQGFAAPRNDLNCPDLYIPTMAFVTYIVLFGLHQVSPALSERRSEVNRSTGVDEPEPSAARHPR